MIIKINILLFTLLKLHFFYVVIYKTVTVKKKLNNV